MIKASNLSTIGRFTVPDIDLAHDASSRDQIVIFGTELALHEKFVEDLYILNFNVTFLIDMVDACDHVRGGRKEFVALRVPVDRAYIRLLIVRICSFYVRDLNMFEITEVIST